LNVIDAENELLIKEPHPLPQIRLNPDVKSIFDFKMEDIELVGYEHDDKIRGVVAV
jgi:thymidylate synthase